MLFVVSVRPVTAMALLSHGMARIHRNPACTLPFTKRGFATTHCAALFASPRSAESSSQRKAQHATNTTVNDMPSHMPQQSANSFKKHKALIRDPLEIVGKELSSLRSNISALLGSGHPALDTIAKYYFQTEGKHVRPLIVLLMARATNGLSPAWSGMMERQSQSDALDQTGIDEPLSPKSILNDLNPNADEKYSAEDQSYRPGSDPSTEKIERLVTEADDQQILPTQRRLAEITEIIHVASLLHDDVIDASDVRRGAPSAPAAFGNKLSILAGDFLLARASVALARLRNNEVLELLATVIANLVEGEVMQLQSKANSSGPQKSAFSALWEGPIPAGAEGTKHTQDSSTQGPSLAMFDNYMQKTYLKTASLIGKSARASAILGGCGDDAIKAQGLGQDARQYAQTIRDAAYQFGRNLGIAFQVSKSPIFRAHADAR